MGCLHRCTVGLVHRSEDAAVTCKPLHSRAEGCTICSALGPPPTLTAHNHPLPFFRTISYVANRLKPLSRTQHHIMPLPATTGLFGSSPPPRPPHKSGAPNCTMWHVQLWRVACVVWHSGRLSTALNIVWVQPCSSPPIQQALFVPGFIKCFYSLQMYVHALGYYLPASSPLPLGTRTAFPCQVTELGTPQCLTYSCTIGFVWIPLTR